MLSSLRARILAVAVAVIVLALAINGVVSYVTVKSHNDNQVAYNLNAVARGNGQAITGWVATRSTMLASMEAAVEDDDPLAALIQLETSGDFMATYIVDADSGQGIFSDRWVPPSDYDPRDRPWYLQAVDMGETTITPPYVDATDATANDLVVTFSRPFYRNGNLVAVVAGDIAIGDVTAIVETIAPTPSSFAFLATADGTLVAHPDPALSLSPTTALSPELDAEFLARLAEESRPQRMELDGRGVLLQGLPIGAGSDWQLVIVLDEGEATAGLRAILGTSTITLLLVALGAAVLLGTLLKVMFRRLQAARDAMENIASGNGDLTRRLPQDGSDEVAQLAASFNRFVAKMEEVLLEVRDSSETVRSAASEIALGGQDLSRRTDSSASSLQQTSASMEEITGTVENTAASAREANQLSLSASQVASRGGEVVSQVVSTMGEITEASRRIGEIVTLMDGIAFQTNLLALNASVEAARAGEQGRGFAVVASEVRQLASRSADAAREIRGLIEASGEKVDAGTRLVHTAGETMQEIVASISRVTEVLGEISTAANEQSDGIGQVNVAVVELDRMVQENAALVEESTVAAEQLQEHSVRLAEAVGGFTLSGHQLTDQRADQGI